MIAVQKYVLLKESNFDPDGRNSEKKFCVESLLEGNIAPLITVSNYTDGQRWNRIF
jgi:hypothetical protein